MFNNIDIMNNKYYLSCILSYNLNLDKGEFIDER